MTKINSKPERSAFIAIDVAKNKNDVLFEFMDGTRKKFKVKNNLEDFTKLYNYIMVNTDGDCMIGLEATSNYHRPIAYFLQSRGLNVKFVPSLGVARTREAIHSTWDKNDPKDAQVIIHMLKTGISQIYHDPFLNNINDIQELSKTHYLISLRKTQTQHSILNHYLPLYFPEAQKYFVSSRAKWFSKMLKTFPSPRSISELSEDEFIKKAWDVTGRKVAKKNFLSDYYHTACNSIGIPVEEESESINMFKLVLQEHNDLCIKRENIEKEADNFLKNNEHYKILRTVPGIGPIIALTIIAEAGDLNRFNHHRQFLKFCGLDLSTEQSGQYRGKSRLSKRGNARLRSVLWMAATVATRMRENTFREKFERYTKKDPNNSDLKRKAYTAVCAKMCRTIYSLVKNNQHYRPYFDETIPSGGIRSVGP